MAEAFIVGNWKMNGLLGDLGQAVAVAEALAKSPAAARAAICPPATLISAMSRALAGSCVAVGGQDCHAERHGAFTGEISAEMLADAGGRLVILGHSERRSGFGETNEIVAAKVAAAVRAGLEPIVCVGETREERDAGRAVDVICTQVAGSLPNACADAAFAVAYEPIWAIGAGVTPTNAEIREAHAAVRVVLVERLGAAGASAPVLYGGSVKPDNAAEILRIPEVGGALVGGASLKAEDFLAILRAG
jgi:triosephosphate isomerase (TIM)